MNRIDLYIYRTITINRKFVRPADRDERRASAEIAIQGRAYRVHVTIDGLDDMRLPGIEERGRHADRDRENARQWMTLCELAWRPALDFEARSNDLPPEIDVLIPLAPGSSGNWTAEALQDYVARGLAGYNLSEWTSGLWQVRPGA